MEECPSLLSGAATATNLNKENHENRKIFVFLIKGKYSGVPLIFPMFLFLFLQFWEPVKNI